MVAALEGWFAVFAHGLAFEGVSGVLRAVLLNSGGEALFIDIGEEIEWLELGVIPTFSSSSPSLSEAGEEDGITLRF